jgi:UPF0176 protein
MTSVLQDKRDLRSREEQRLAVKAEGVPRTTVSFYRYVQIADPDAFRQKLLTRWGALGCLGRIYVAREGINAQMNVPTKYWDQFDAFNKTLPELQGVPYKIAVEEADVPSFFKLSIKVKDRIVADGIEDPSFDPSQTGAYLSAREFNEYIDDPDAVVVDMRNAYESEVGHFENALTPDVETFREELAVVPELLRVHKNKKIALYCTGGIRCEKASAWLKHQGFENVRHLRGGIIDYAHQVEREGLPNRFRGKNFVFDERLGERISNDIIATCHLCRTTACDTHHHCAFEPCHILFIGCEPCMARRGGYCSHSCRLLDQLPVSLKKRYARLVAKKHRRQFKKAPLRTRTS